MSTGTGAPAIRRATNRDIPLIRDMAVRTWRDTYRGVIPEESQDAVLKVAYSMSSLLRSIRLNAFLIAELDGEPSGFADLGMRVDGTLVLHRLYVLPQAQRVGVGATLLTSTISRMLGPTYRIVAMRTCSAIPVHIPGLAYPLIATVERDNQKARAFYRKMGFVEGREETVILAGVPLPLVNIAAQVHKSGEDSPATQVHAPRSQARVARQYSQD